MSALDMTAVEPQLKAYLLELARKRGKALDDLDRAEALIERGIFDSMSLLDFVVFAEKVSGLKIPGGDIHPENFGSLAAIMGYLQSRG